MEWLTSRWNCSKETVVDIIHEQYVQTDVQAKYANESVQRALHRNVPSINPALLDPQPEPPPQDVEEDQASYDQDWKCSQKSLLWRPQPDEYLGGQDPHADSQTVDPLVDNLGQQLQIEYPLGQLITDSNAIFSGSGSEPYTGFSEMLQPEIVETPSRQVGISGIEMGLSGANPYTNPSGPFTSIPSRYGLSLSSTVQGAATPINALSSPPAHHQYFEQCVRSRSL